MKKIIDLSTYPRRSHFEYFGAMAFPYVGLTANVDVTNLIRYAKERGGSSFHAVLWTAAKAANSIAELRQRIVDGQIVEFDHCNAGYTVAKEDHTFCNCDVETRMSLEEFLVDAKRRQAEAIKQTDFVNPDEDEIGQIFDNRDHSTVLYAIRKVETALKAGDSHIQNNVRDITANINSCL